MEKRFLSFGFTAIALLTSCDDGEPVDNAPRAAQACVPDAAGQALTIEDVEAPGPFFAGHASYTLVDATRTTPAHGQNAELPQRTLPTKVWYPSAGPGADTIAPGGPFPLVAYSHGFSSSNAEGTPLAEQLASLGYIVVAPQFPLSALTTPGGPTGIDVAQQPVDIAFVISWALEQSATAGNSLSGGVDPTRIASVGLSMGGLTSLLVGYHVTLRDPRVGLVVAMAPVANIFADTYYDTSESPLLLLAGDIDAIVPYQENARVAFERANAPVNLYTLITGTHTGFTSSAAGFESADNCDTIGCSVIIGGSHGDDPTGAAIVASLGGADAGVVAGPNGPVCPSPLPIGMRPSRQMELEILAISSYLQAYLATDPVVRGRSCHFHERVLSKQKDVHFERR